MLKRTPFFEIHQQSGAKLIDFGGFEMPVHYAGILKEHQSVRDAAGIFDVSHMGEIYVRGAHARALVQYATINDVTKLIPGKVQYSAFCYENGGIVDDLLVYMLSEVEYLLVVNASNKDKDLAWLVGLNAQFGAEIEDVSEDMCLLAVQGPASVALLQTLTSVNLSEITYYSFKIGDFAGFNEVILSATGYTGEKGFEIYFDRRMTDPSMVWHQIMEAGASAGIQPAGLGARDTLRLEMGYALYGNDISSETSPLEAGLGWVTKLDKGDFCGREALLRQKEVGLERRLVGFVTEDRRAIPRSHYVLRDADGNAIGEVTSGGQSVGLGKGVGMGYVKMGFHTTGQTIFVEIRNNLFPATVVKPPFISKG